MKIRQIQVEISRLDDRQRLITAKEQPRMKELKIIPEFPQKCNTNQDSILLFITPFSAPVDKSANERGTNTYDEAHARCNY